jgi:hypothetical protein
MPNSPLPPDRLRHGCDPSSLPFETTADLGEAPGEARHRPGNHGTESGPCLPLFTVSGEAARGDRARRSEGPDRNTLSVGPQRPAHARTASTRLFIAQLAMQDHSVARDRPKNSEARLGLSA